jgi:hypothetical protein
MVAHARKHYRVAVMNATGVEPMTCPWRAFDDPDVAEVMRLYRWFESGQLALAIGSDPPNALVEAIGIYHGALSSVRAHDTRARQTNPKR